MTTTDLPASDARVTAIGCLRSEHRMLARVIEALETLTAEVAEMTTEPDFTLFAAILYYIDVVPERLHHPKEDQYLFAALRRCDPSATALIERLESDHQRSPELIGELQRAMVHWQGGAGKGLDEFTLALGNFCEFHWAHMRLEESEILSRAERHLSTDDWTGIAQAFAANADPLFGAQPSREFERLYHRIANLAPRKLRLGLLKRDQS